MTFRLHMVARLSERVSEDYYRQRFDLSLPECRVIGITGGYGSVSFKKVASDTYLEKSYASRVVSALVDRGIIEKLENPSDSRSVLLSLTPHGVAVHDQMHKAAIRLNEWLSTDLLNSQVEQLTATLRHLETKLESLSHSLEEIEQASETPDAALTGSPARQTGAIALDRDLAQTLADALALQLGR
ncbi:MULTISPECIES: MarR family winged helix-turn-helix transcriptional regulator [unclassified Brevundimonas]|uniref:MarR family winged helix-turn-helix transcriptional regulator n=1 Tax=unclassified Brevundimonas TaxID=2622653 RepID=UPI00143196AC|nr:MULTISPECIES: MarR family winged helix-turn-helix transcriptional regulator [unclassified Brevundimonas]